MKYVAVIFRFEASSLYIRGARSGVEDALRYRGFALGDDGVHWTKPNSWSFAVMSIDA